ncbi:MAG TPA: hypothetical protein VKU01_26900 [Bryobacteraceae bacterium]|nr:hypothetical protein [Bryobacteraceae bacterium]
MVEVMEATPTAETLCSPGAETLYNPEEDALDTHERGRSVLRWAMLAAMWAIAVLYILPYFAGRVTQIVSWPGL